MILWRKKSFAGFDHNQGALPTYLNVSSERLVKGFFKKNRNLWLQKGLPNSPGAGAVLSEQLREGESVVLAALNGFTEGKTSREKS